jgi:hypothetical protein
MADRDVAHRAAVLAHDRSVKDIFRRLKWDIFAEWAGKQMLPEEREELHAELRAIGRIQAKIATLAAAAELTKRKEEAAKRKKDRVRDPLGW